MGASQVRELPSKLVAAKTTAREVAADGVTDMTLSFGFDEAAVISRVLVWLAVVETGDSVREAQVHALAELPEFDLVPTGVFSGVGRLSLIELHGSSIEHFEYLQSLGGASS